MFRRFYHNYHWIRVDEKNYLLKSAIFTSLTVAGSFGLAHYVEQAKKQQKRKNPFGLFGSAGNPFANAYSNLQKRKRMIMHFPFLGNAYVSLEKRWNSLRSYEKTIYSLIALNGLVYALSFSKSSKIHSFINKHFVCRFHAPLYTNVTSAFAHSTLGHLGFNMIALYSFGTFLHQLYGREQFLALYVSSAAFSSFTSLLGKFFIQNCYQGSLGASGAIYSILGNMYFFKNIKVAFIFFPFWHIPLNLAVIGLFAFDCYGLLRRMTKFDHSAHIGGLLFGLAYHRYFSKRPENSSDKSSRRPR